LCKGHRDYQPRESPKSGSRIPPHLPVVRLAAIYVEWALLKFFSSDTYTFKTASRLGNVTFTGLRDIEPRENLFRLLLKTHQAMSEHAGRSCLHPNSEQCWCHRGKNVLPQASIGPFGHTPRVVLGSSRVVCRPGRWSPCLGPDADRLVYVTVHHARATGCGVRRWSM